MSDVMVRVVSFPRVAVEMPIPASIFVRSMEENRIVVRVAAQQVEPTYEDYTGSYDITPLITAQRLPTANKHMTSDVLVRMIPTSEVQNSAGGVTFTIGG